MCDDSGVIKPEKLKRSFIKILKITTWASLAYLSIRAVDFALSGNIDEFLKRYIFSVKPWVGMVLIDGGFSPHLWYLVAFLQVLIIVYLCVKFHLTKLLYWSIPVCLALNLILGKYSPLFGLGSYDIMLHVHRNSITIGLPCVAIGLLLRQNRSSLPKLPQAFALTLVTGFFLYAEAVMHKFTIFGTISGDIGILTVPLAAAVFVLFYRLDKGTRLEAVCATLGREHSLNIYIWHYMFVLIAIRIIEIYGLHNTLFSDITAFVAAVATLFFSFALNNLSSKFRRTTPGVQTSTLPQDSGSRS